MQRRQEASFALMMVRVTILRENLHFSIWEHVSSLLLKLKTNLELSYAKALILI